ncbi:hypothetical protein SBA3_740010 [Candidatus Sulfopaludibacter sp. SbA3]|nr:hypothetical protein SBA3_740010 [Candidatus Sulfopaludibacter sp. SbA3]
MVGRDPYSNGEFLLFPKEDRLWAQNFNPRTAQVEGPKVVIADDAGQFTMSLTGSLVFRKASAELNSLGWYDRTGKLLLDVGQKGDYWDVQLSPDGERAAVVNHRSSSGLFWIDVIEIERNVQTPFSDFTAIGHAPVWTRDGKALYFGIFGKESNRVASKPIEAASAATTQFTSKERYQPRDLSPDGKTLLADQVVSPTRQIVVISPIPQIQWRPVTSVPGVTAKAQFSSDGRWIVYQSDETGALEIYITDFPGMQQKKRISANGGQEARWRRDGKELYYLAGNGDLMAVQIGSSPLEAGKATVLFRFHGRSDDLDAGFQYAPAGDGQRFLMVNGDAGGGARDLRVIFDWPELAGRK